MAWTIEFTLSAERELQKIDRRWQRGILDYLDHRIAPLDNPRRHGKALVGDLKGLWRYRVGDYRLLCRLEDNRLVVLVITIGHRSDVYG